jgi:hypothetical protein
MSKKLRKLHRIIKGSRNLPKIECDEARRVIVNHDISDRDKVVAAQFHVVKCLKCLNAISATLPYDINTIKNLLIEDNKIHPEHRRKL